MKTGVIIISTTLCIFAALSVSAQSKFFSTSSRGGAEGAKQSAQVSTLQGENERMNACTAVGRIYAPTHPNRDSNDCIQHLTLDPATGAATFTNGVTINSGGTNVTGNSTFNNNLTVGGATTVNNTLNVTGTSTFGNNMTVNGRVTASQLFVGSGNVGAIPTCTSAQKLQWNGTAWTCVTDNIGATAATETDPKVGTLTNGRWCRTDGARIHCDVAAPPACGTAQKLQWDGSAWSCVADSGDNLGAGGETSGQITIRNVAPTLFLADSDHRSGMVHVNSNIMYFLRGCGTGSTSWCQTNGQWPLYLNLENNDAVVGNNVNAQDVYIRKIGKWASELSGSGSGGAQCGANLSGSCGNNNTYQHGQTWVVSSSCSWWDCGWTTNYHCQCYNGSRNLTGTSQGSYCSHGCSGGDDFGDW
jgi:cytoskeletal protein CcmA (bactofilin family)